MKRHRPPKNRPGYRVLWRVVEGAVVDAFNAHPDYFTEHGRKAAARSICKRVVGHVLSLAEQSAGGRNNAAGRG